MTRLNMVPSEANPETQTTALIPLWDMCNHTNGEVISVQAFAIANRCLSYSLRVDVSDNYVFQC